MERAKIAPPPIKPYARYNIRQTCVYECVFVCIWVCVCVCARVQPRPARTSRGSRSQRRYHFGRNETSDRHLHAAVCCIDNFCSDWARTFARLIMHGQDPAQNPSYGCGAYSRQIADPFPVCCCNTSLLLSFSLSGNTLYSLSFSPLRPHPQPPEQQSALNCALFKTSLFNKSAASKF